MGTSENQGGPTSAAPYVSFATFRNAIDKMNQEGGVPSQVDRSYLRNMPGSTQTALINALKQLGLITDDLKPTDALEDLVAADDPVRKAGVGGLLRKHFAPQIALGPLATQGQLEKTFREAGVSGSTVRKAIAFFLAAAKYAGLPVSPHFHTPKAPPGSGERSKARKPEVTNKVPPPLTQDEPASVAYHPLIAGLFKELPPPGAAFPQSKQDDWIDLAKVTFRMIYKSDSAPKVSTPTAGGESD